MCNSVTHGSKSKFEGEKMDKSVPYSAFPLPGLASEGKKPYKRIATHGFQTTSPNSAACPGDSNHHNRLPDALSLVDENGLFLPPRSEQSLEHLTKSRPRSHGRRSPSPSARRKFETPDYGSFSINDVVKPVAQTPGSEIGKDSSPERKGRRLSSSSNSESRERKSRGKKYVSVKNDLKGNRDFGDLPPPLPLSPPPLDGIPSDPEKESRNFVVDELKTSVIRKFPSSSASATQTNNSSSMSTKMDLPRVGVDISPSRNTVFNSEGNTGRIPVSNLPNLSGDSFSKNNRTDLSKGSSYDRQASFDSGINSLVSQSPKYQRRSVELEKSSSTRRRRFKPVAIPDASEADAQLFETLPHSVESSSQSDIFMVDKLNRTFPRATTSKSLFETWLESSQGRKYTERGSVGHNDVTSATTPIPPNEHDRLDGEHQQSIWDDNRKDENGEKLRTELCGTSETPTLNSNMIVEHNNNSRKMPTTTTTTATKLVASSKDNENKNSYDSELRTLPVLVMGDEKEKKFAELNGENTVSRPNGGLVDVSSNSGDMSDIDERDNITPAGILQLESTPTLVAEHSGQKTLKSCTDTEGNKIIERNPKETPRSAAGSSRGNSISQGVVDLEQHRNDGKRC